MIASQELFKKLHHDGLPLGDSTQAGPSREFLLAHRCLVAEIDFWHVDLESVVQAVKLEEFSDQLGAQHSRSALHDFLGIGIVPVEA